MPIIISVFAAVLPMILYLSLLWKMDKYDKEPLSLLILHFFWGAVGAILLGIGGSAILSFPLFIFNNDLNFRNLIQTSFIAPVCEELAKGFFLIFTVKSKRFDNITDGLVYGGAIGLGFAMTENMLYFITYGTTITSWIFIVAIRTLFSGVMHCISTGTFGALLAIAKFSDYRWTKLLPFIGFLCAMLIHSVWNSLVMFEDTMLFGIIFMIFSILFFIFVFRLSLRNEKQIIESELTDECKSGLIPETHLITLFSHHRYKTGWIDEKIRKLYYRNAVRLAFNKYQFRRAKGTEFIYYEFEIEKNREIIRTLLTKNISR